MPGTEHKITVVGTGYVGLTSGACLARLGHRVTCVDIDEEKIQAISSGQLPIYEEGLSEIVISEMRSGRLEFTTDLLTAVQDAEFVFLCLPTPPGHNGEADLTAIKAVAGQLRGQLSPGSVVVNKSTVPVNSARLVAELIGDSHIDVVSNPEFLREGSAVQDFLNPDRIVVGSDNPHAGERVGALYLGARCPVVVTDPVSAECIKYMANAFLALKISFVNQSADFCDAVGADVTEVMRGLSFDPRIGATFLSPGPGWGGSCFPKDTTALVSSARSVNRPMTLIEEAIDANSRHMKRTTEIIHRAAIESREPRPKIGLLGLSFKANTDDTRESPALEILRHLSENFDDLIAYDPLAKISEDVKVFRAVSIQEAIAGSDVVAILTEWPEFSLLTPADFLGQMRGNTVVDTRYILDPRRFNGSGVRLVSIGR